MKNQNKENGTAPVTSQEKRAKKMGGMDPLQRIETSVAQVIKLQRALLKTLKGIDASINILAAQKARELTPEEPQNETAH